MKCFITILLTLQCIVSYAGGGHDYYQKIGRKLSGHELKTALKNLLKQTHRDQGYSNLLNVYFKSDRDTQYDQDGSLVDIYSEDPQVEDPYNFVSKKQCCGHYRGEADCFNREHIFPQSAYGSRYPMRSDFFHVYATDGYVNSKRSSYPFGEVDEPHWTSRNGSKLGINTFGKQRLIVFEPIDEFKGDIARALFYFATRYEDEVLSFNYEILNGTTGQVYKNWFVRLLLKWHRLDPVSEHETRRNRAGYNYQGNRNPYIDHPEWVEKVWSKHY